MTFTSTRSVLSVDSLATILRGLAPDGGLFVPTAINGFKGVKGLKGVEGVEGAKGLEGAGTLAGAERFALGAFFDDIPEEVREAAIANLLAKFPASDPVPLVDLGDFKMLELFHGPTGAFKDVALSILPVLMAEAARRAGREKVLVLTATSGDTGSAAMAGFANVPGVEVAVFFPHTGTSRIQRLQMTTPSAANVHGIAIRGNFDDAQAAVKRIFSSAEFRAEAEAAGITLSSANSINTGRLVPQIAYYLHAAAKIKEQIGEADLRVGKFDVVVPSGNFGNILAAYYAKLLGAPIDRLVCASNVNDVLTRFIATGTYDPGDRFTVTNSPSMDIRKSSNVERLLWLVNGGLDDPAKAAEKTKQLMEDFASTGRYTLDDDARARLQADFVCGMADPDETEAEMRHLRADTRGYIVDPHTAVATCVARKLGLPDGKPCVVAATATPYKFPETCLRAFGEDVLGNPPPAFVALESAPVTQNQVVDVEAIPAAVRALFAAQ